MDVNSTVRKSFDNSQAHSQSSVIEASMKEESATYLKESYFPFIAVWMSAITRQYPISGIKNLLENLQNVENIF